MEILAPKGPDEVIFYEFDWATKRLEAGEVIVSSAWSISGGSVEIAVSPPSSEVDGVTRVYVEGGEVGDVCYLTNSVVTNLNPQRDFTGKLKVKTK